MRTCPTSTRRRRTSKSSPTRATSAGRAGVRSATSRSPRSSIPSWPGRRSAPESSSPTSASRRACSATGPGGSQTVGWWPPSRPPRRLASPTPTEARRSRARTRSRSRFRARTAPTSSRPLHGQVVRGDRRQARPESGPSEASRRSSVRSRRRPPAPRGRPGGRGLRCGSLSPAGADPFRVPRARPRRPPRATV